jgi:hypothetical protein
MIGERQLPQGSLIYEFRLEEHVPADHLVRAIDRFVDLAEECQELCVSGHRPGSTLIALSPAAGRSAPRT